MRFLTRGVWGWMQPAQGAPPPQISAPRGEFQLPRGRLCLEEDHDTFWGMPKGLRYLFKEQVAFYPPRAGIILRFSKGFFRTIA